MKKSFWFTIQRMSDEEAANKWCERLHPYNSGEYEDAFIAGATFARQQCADDVMRHRAEFSELATALAALKKEGFSWSKEHGVLYSADSIVMKRHDEAVVLKRKLEVAKEALERIAEAHPTRSWQVIASSRGAFAREALARISDEGDEE